MVKSSCLYVITTLVSAVEESAMLQATIQSGGELEESSDSLLEIGEDEEKSAVFISASGDISSSRQEPYTTTTTTKVAKGFCSGSGCGCLSPSCCSDGDVDEVCPLFSGGRQWMPYYYKCLKQNCLNQQGLFCGTSCEDILNTHTCDDPLSVLSPCESVGMGLISDACPRTCKVECECEDPQEYRTCVIKGDPHIQTFDFESQKNLVGVTPEGFNAEFYEYGDYWVVKSEKLWVQARYTQLEFMIRQERAAGLKLDELPQSSVSALAVKVPGSAHTLVIEPKEYGDMKLDGEVVEISSGGFKNDWLHYEFLVDVDLRKGGRCHMHRFTVHPDSKYNTTINVVRCLENLDLQIIMAKPKSCEGHCGNFNDDAADDLPLSKTRIADDDLMFEPWNWEQATTSNCNETSYQKALRHCNKLRLELWGDDDTDAYDMDACVVDYCLKDGKVEVSDADFASKVWARHSGRVSCPERAGRLGNNQKDVWVQIGGHNGDLATKSTINWSRTFAAADKHSATTTEKCRDLCEKVEDEGKKGGCKAFVFGVEDDGYICKGFADFTALSPRNTAGTNRVLCANLAAAVP